MPYEIDFLAVGDGSKGGDAITLRFGPDLTRRDGHKVVVIDGGRPSNGPEVVRHILTVYKTADVDVVLNTHLDIDHAGGLKTVVECLNVNVLAMHRPWLHAGRVRWTFSNGRLTTLGLADKMRAAAEAAHDVEQAALSRDVTIIEPFAGAFLNAAAGSLRVLGPGLPYYEGLLCHFEDTPAARFPQSSGIRQATGCRTQFESYLPWSETIREGETTSAENNSSVVSLLQCDGRRVLLTGDAGVEALWKALSYALAIGIDPRTIPFDLLQVPHHGSRHNVSPSLLDYARAASAVISAPPLNEHHPSPNVVNALLRRGTGVYSTRGRAFYQYSGVNLRAGWFPAVPLGFSPLVAA